MDECSCRCSSFSRFSNRLTIADEVKRQPRPNTIVLAGSCVTSDEPMGTAFSAVVAHIASVPMPLVTRCGLQMIVVLLSFLLSAQPSHASTSPQQFSVPFEDRSDNRVVVHATINSTPVSLMLDTAANISLLDASVAKSLGLSLVPIGKIATLYGDRTLYSLPNLSFTLADYKDTSIAFGAIDESIFTARDASGRKVDGILGYTFLRSKTLEINYITHVLTIYSSKTTTPICHGASADFPLTFAAVNLPYPVLPVAINGKARKAFLDTGAVVPMAISASELASLGLATTSTRGAPYIDLDSLTVGKHVSTPLADSRVQKQIGHTIGALGSQAFLKSILILDYAHNRVCVIDP